ncbi:MAG: adenosine kinase [Bacteroidetes bacterium]|nr:MAG: adenosine kinase [Bacteroidota bacterium]
MAKILGMGNALVDMLIQIDGDDFLEKNNLPKGSMQLVDWDTASNVLAMSEGFQRSQASGGSAANTIHGLAKLGVETGFIGKVGKDEIGEFFKKDLFDAGVNPQLAESETKSGVAVALVSPDSERTFATFLGAAVEISAEDLTAEMFAGYDYFHIEGYLVQNYALVERAVILAKENGLKISLDLASYNVVEDNLEFLQRIIKEYVDIVFANEEEAKSFTGKEPEEALHAIAEVAEYAIVKIGSKGSMVKHQGKVYTAGVIEANSIDTTGAGDLYASGFLYGLHKGVSLDEAARIGSITAGNVIEVIGAKMDEERWQRIYDMIG